MPLLGNRAEPVAIWKARKYIEEHSGEELSLTRVAKVVNMNANYLSENFKQVTGINFVEYVAHTRFEMRVIFCEIQVCGSVKSRSLRGFNRSRNSIAFSKDFRVNRRRNIALPSVCDRQDIGKILKGAVKNARKNA